jgi:hypothetical protein
MLLVVSSVWILPTGMHLFMHLHTRTCTTANTFRVSCKYNALELSLVVRMARTYPFVLMDAM